MTTYMGVKAIEPRLLVSLQGTDLTVTKIASLLFAGVWDKMSIPMSEKLSVARDIKAGKSVDMIKFGIYSIREVDTTFTAEYIPGVDYWTIQQEKWDYHAKLLNAAVEGDAESAIKYCKLVKSGEIVHGQAFA